MSFRYIVIDDAPFVSELIKNILKDSGGLCVGAAVNGEEGFRLFQKTLPDLVILDMVMPKENGIELARKIREITHEVIIVACSTLDDRNIIDNAKDIGCNEYVVKPFTKEGFLQVVEKHFKFKPEKAK
ncbi:response regulator [Bdellovibrio sp. HCB337]|uniref:response regulator n=1 Tax=Bdellovibrio sp. HCB337 TaxID=3394358 RepID=UPI0039A75D13